MVPGSSPGGTTEKNPNMLIFKLLGFFYLSLCHLYFRTILAKATTVGKVALRTHRGIHRNRPSELYSKAALPFTLHLKKKNGGLVNGEYY